MVWPQEIEKWANFNHLKCAVLHKGWHINRDISILDPTIDIFIMNPEGLPWLMTKLKRKRKAKWPFDFLCVDESTAFKNIASKKNQRLRKLLPGFKRRYILTGTPVPNGLIDIHGQMALVDHGQTFGNTAGEFKRRYFKLVGDPKWGNWQPKDDVSIDKVYKRIAPWAIRLRARDHLDLPERLTNPIYVDMPKKARKHYDELEDELFTLIESHEMDVPSTGAVIQKLHQIANGRVYASEDPLQPKIPTHKREVFIMHSAKLDALENLVDELNGKPLMIAYYFKHDLVALKERFKKRLIFIDSKTKMNECVAYQDKWNAGKIRLFALNPGVNSFGLNLQQGGADICWYSIIWNWEHYEQMIKRLERQGSTAEYIRNHTIICNNTIDLMIMAALNRKEGEHFSFSNALVDYRNIRLEDPISIDIVRRKKIDKLSKGWLENDQLCA